MPEPPCSWQRLEADGVQSTGFDNTGLSPGRSLNTHLSEPPEGTLGQCHRTNNRVFLKTALSSSERPGVRRL